MNRLAIVAIALILLGTKSIIDCQTTEDPPTTTTTTTTITTTTVTTTTITTTTTSSSLDSCFIANATCKECLQDTNCFFCNEDNSCRTYKLKGIFPEGCKASSSRWFNCSLNFEALIISVIVVGVVVLILIAFCVCYCCNKTCKACSDRNMQRVERKIAKQRDRIKQNQQAKKQERKVKSDEMRVKYGLKPATYSPLED